MATNEQPAYRTVDKFDRLLGALCDLPDVTHTKPSTVVTTSALIGASQTFILQTFRQSEIGDTIFLQYVDDTGSIRIAIPPAAADCIARQRDALTAKNRKRAAKAEASRRKAMGEKPGFKMTPEEREQRKILRMQKKQA
jgi:hypothetical protein